MINYYNSYNKLIYMYYLLNISWSNEENKELIDLLIKKENSITKSIYLHSEKEYQLNLSNCDDDIHSRINFNHLNELQVLKMCNNKKSIKSIRNFGIFVNLEKLNISGISLL